MKMNGFFIHFRSFSGHQRDGQDAYFLNGKLPSYPFDFAQERGSIRFLTESLSTNGTTLPVRPRIASGAGSECFAQQNVSKGCSRTGDAYSHFLKSFNKPHRFVQQVAAATDKVFYHIFLTCKCFMVINVRWLRSLFYTTAQTCGSSYNQN